ncbi:MAG: ABC transporter substrate-binding protein, partial [Dehalococcoidia bacterium]
MKRTASAILALLLIAALLATGCSNDSNSSATPQTSTAEKQQTEPTSSAPTLYLAVGGEDTTGYDPTLGWGRYGSPLFQSTLLKRDDNLNIVNDLAESYSVSEDGLTWKVKIRKDVLFSDGIPLTAEDVAYTYNTTSTSGGRIDITNMKEAIATSDYAVEFHLQKAQTTFLYKLTTLGIVPKHAHDKNYASHPIGSGPYKFVRWDQGQQLIVEVNPYYYGAKPQIKRLVFLFMSEDAGFAAAKAGEVQVVAVPQMMAVQKIPGMTIHPVSSVDNRGLMFPMLP